MPKQCGYLLECVLVALKRYDLSNAGVCAICSCVCVSKTLRSKMPWFTLGTTRIDPVQGLHAKMHRVLAAGSCVAKTLRSCVSVQKAMTNV